jgi:hypothetical protein
MSKYRFLCRAFATNTNGAEQTYCVHRVSRDAFIIFDDVGDSHISQGRKVSARDISDEIMLCYNVYNVRLDGNMDDNIKSSTWPERHGQCLNCGCESSRRVYGKGGYCRECYKVIRRMKSFGGAKISKQMSEEQFVQYEKETIWQLEQRLVYLRKREQQRLGVRPVGKPDLESKLAFICKYTKVRISELDINKWLGHLDQYTYEQRCSIIFRVLDDIEEGVKFKFEWWEAFLRSQAS